MRARNRSFTDVAGYRDNGYTATGLGNPTHVEAENMPRGFQFPVRTEARDMWTTLSLWVEKDAIGSAPMTTQCGNRTLDVIGQLYPRFASRAGESYSGVAL